MRTVNVRELRGEIPKLRETLAREQELLLVSNGEPVARILPVAPKQKVRSLAAFRATMKQLPAGTIEKSIRDDRDTR